MDKPIPVLAIAEFAIVCALLVLLASRTGIEIQLMVLAALVLLLLADWLIRPVCK